MVLLMLNRGFRLFFIDYFSPFVYNISTFQLERGLYMINKLYYKGEEIGVGGTYNQYVGPIIMKDYMSGLAIEDEAKNDMEQFKNISNQIADNKYLRDKIKMYPTLLLGALVPLSISAFLKVTNIDNIYISPNINLSEFMSVHGQMMSFSDLVTRFLFDASLIYTPAALLHKGLKRHDLTVEINKLCDKISYYQLVFGALKARANELGLELDISDTENINVRKRVNK